jgi:hypothetical protein
MKNVPCLDCTEECVARGIVDEFLALDKKLKRTKDIKAFLDGLMPLISKVVKLTDDANISLNDRMHLTHFGLFLVEVAQNVNKLATLFSLMANLRNIQDKETVPESAVMH